MISKKTINTKLELTLHSSIAQMTYKLDANAVKSWLFLIAKVFKQLNVNEAQEFEIPLKDLCEYLSIETRNRKYLEEMLFSIRQTGIRLNILGKDFDNIKEVGLFASVGIIDGKVTFEIPKDIKRKLIEFEEMFVILNLLLLRDFKNKHALSLYIFLSDYLIKNIEQTEKILTLEELRELLDIKVSEYAEYKILNRDVLKKAVDEINKKSSLQISYKPYHKVKRKIKSLKFTFKTIKPLDTKKNKVQISIDEPTPEPEVIKSISVESPYKPLQTKSLVIMPKDKIVLEYLDKHQIILKNLKHQKRLKELLGEVGKENFNNYFLYLINEIMPEKFQAIQENVNGTKNVAGFFIGLLRSSEYITGFKNKLKEEVKKKEFLTEKIDALFRKNLENLYLKESRDSFISHIESNREKYEPIIQNIIYTCDNPFIKDIAVNKSWKNPATMSLLYQETKNFDYYPLLFEEWKSKFLEDIKNKGIIEKLQSKAEKKVNK